MHLVPPKLYFSPHCDVCNFLSSAGPRFCHHFDVCMFISLCSSVGPDFTSGWEYRLHTLQLCTSIWGKNVDLKHKKYFLPLKSSIFCHYLLETLAFKRSYPAELLFEKLIIEGIICFLSRMFFP